MNCNKYMLRLIYWVNAVLKRNIVPKTIVIIDDHHIFEFNTIPIHAHGIFVQILNVDFHKSQMKWTVHRSNFVNKLFDSWPLIYMGMDMNVEYYNGQFWFVVCVLLYIGLRYCEWVSYKIVNLDLFHDWFLIEVTEWHWILHVHSVFLKARYFSKISTWINIHDANVKSFGKLNTNWLLTSFSLNIERRS